MQRRVTTERLGQLARRQGKHAAAPATVATARTKADALRLEHGDRPIWAGEREVVGSPQTAEAAADNGDINFATARCGGDGPITRVGFVPHRALHGVLERDVGEAVGRCD